MLVIVDVVNLGPLPDAWSRSHASFSSSSAFMANCMSDDQNPKNEIIYPAVVNYSQFMRLFTSFRIFELTFLIFLCRMRRAVTSW